MAFAIWNILNLGTLNIDFYFLFDYIIIICILNNKGQNTKVLLI